MRRLLLLWWFSCSDRRNSSTCCSDSHSRKRSGRFGVFWKIGSHLSRVWLKASLLASPSFIFSLPFSSSTSFLLPFFPPSPFLLHHSFHQLFFFPSLLSFFTHSSIITASFSLTLSFLPSLHPSFPSLLPLSNLKHFLSFLSAHVCSVSFFEGETSSFAR